MLESSYAPLALLLLLLFLSSFPTILGAALAFVRHHPVQENDDEDSEHDHVTHVFARRRV